MKDSGGLGKMIRWKRKERGAFERRELGNEEERRRC